MTTITRGYTTSRYGQLHYREGRPDRPSTLSTLVLLHQNPSSSLEYDALIAAMAADRRVLAFDTPGYGMSDPPPGPVPADHYAGAVLDGLAAMGVAGPLDLFGFHTGTVLALELAHLAPTLVGRLALVGVPYRTADERAERLAKIHAVAPPTDDGAEIFTRLKWLWDFTVAERAPGVPIERMADVFIDRARALHRYWWPYDAVWRYPMEARFAATSQPVLILTPDEMLKDQSVAAAAFFPDARVIDLPELNREIFEPAGGVDRLAAELRAFFA